MQPSLRKHNNLLTRNFLFVPLLALLAFILHRLQQQHYAPDLSHPSGYPSSQPPNHLTMAWRSHGATNTALIENLATNKLINAPRVKAAMLSVRTNPPPPTPSSYPTPLTLAPPRSTAPTTPPRPLTKTAPNPSATPRQSAHHICTPTLPNPCSPTFTRAPES